MEQTLQQKIKEIKQRAAPINYSTVSVNEIGELQERESLLDKRIVEGYGVIWGKINAHRERFHKGSQKRSIQENGPKSGANYEIKFRDEHGRACALFDVLKEDDIGLYFRTKPLDSVSWCDDLLTQLRSKTINNFSQGFDYVFSKGAMEWNEQDECIDVYEAQLLEISAVAIPSDKYTFAKRSLEHSDELYDLTEDFIKSLPPKHKFEARQLFTHYRTLLMNEPLEQRDIAPIVEQPSANKGIDYNYLLNNFKI